MKKSQIIKKLLDYQQILRVEFKKKKQSPMQLQEELDNPTVRAGGFHRLHHLLHWETEKQQGWKQPKEQCQLAFNGNLENPIKQQQDSIIFKGTWQMYQSRA